MYWNAGICATGAGAADIALEIWKQLGSKIEIRRFGLPDGGYAQCKVRLAERPLAERNKDNDDPGLKETIWIERLSPCHGAEEETQYVVTGRVAAPPELSPMDLLKQLDAALSQRAPWRIYIPDLCEAAGLSDCAAVERRRYGMLREN